MKKVLGLIGSPRNLGNCEIMVKEISRQIPVSHDLSLLRLSDFNIRPCRGCYRCLPEGKRCVIIDDLNTVLEAMCDADALIVAVPTYFLSANACLKLLLDRGLSFYNHSEKLWQKPAVGIGIAGIAGGEGFTLLGIQNFLKLILAREKGCRIIYGALPGEIFMNEDNKKVAADMASALFGSLPEKSDPCCPICGGDTFRFLGNDRIRCMLCSISGTLISENDRPAFEMNRNGDMIFASAQDALKHRDWLLGMKHDFIEKKATLKKISIDYRRKGQWIKPVEATETNKNRRLPKSF
jgi:multimeric flavodoxin WrbA